MRASQDGHFLYPLHPPTLRWFNPEHGTRVQHKAPSDPQTEAGGGAAFVAGCITGEVGGESKGSSAEETRATASGGRVASSASTAASSSASSGASNVMIVRTPSSEPSRG